MSAHWKTLKREIARNGREAVYIVEGEFDVWSLHRLGIRNVIGTLRHQQYPQGHRLLFWMRSASSEFIYLVDNDKAGDEGRLKV